MALLKLSRNTQIMAFLGGMVLVAHLYFQNLYVPLQKEIRHLRFEKEHVASESPNYEVERIELERMEERYKRAFEEYSEFEEGVRGLEGKLPSLKAVRLTLSLLF